MSLEVLKTYPSRLKGFRSPFKPLPYSAIKFTSYLNAVNNVQIVILSTKIRM